MNIQIEKYQIINSIINSDNIEILQKIKLLLMETPSQKVKPMSLEDFYNRISASQNAYEEGKVTSHADLKNEIKLWKNNR